jgi:hypothetical protein
MKSKSSTLTSCSRCDRWSKESQKQSVAKGENEGTSSSSTAPLSGSWPVLDVTFFTQCHQVRRDLLDAHHLVRHITPRYLWKRTDPLDLWFLPATGRLGDALHMHPRGFSHGLTHPAAFVIGKSF